jgi:hypothetical protein
MEDKGHNGGQGTQWPTMHPVQGLQVQEGGLSHMLYSRLNAPYTQQCSSFPIHFSIMDANATPVGKSTCAVSAVDASNAEGSVES